MQLDHIQSAIRGCTACVDAGFIPIANPVFRGSPDHRFMILGQAPAARGHLNEVPYAGTAGVRLRGWLAEAGFTGPDALEREFYLTSLTKCFPGPSASGKGDRAPSRKEIALCSHHLDREIAVVRPELIVTLGRLAANVIVGPGSLTELVGTSRQAKRNGHAFTAIPFPHPSGVSHWLNGEPGLGCLGRAIVNLAHIRESVAET